MLVMARMSLGFGIFAFASLTLLADWLMLKAFRKEQPSQ